MALTFEQVKAYCRNHLGYPVVEVELVDEQYQTVLGKALRHVAYNKPVRTRVPVAVAAGVVAYDLSAEDTGYAVIDVEIPPDSFLLNAEFDVFNPRVMEHPMNLGDFELGSIYSKTAKQTMGADFEWEFNKVTKELLISPIPSRSYTAQVVCLNKVELVNIISPWLEEWVMKMSLASAKQLLGSIRRKVRTVEGTELTFELDGAELIQEGLEAEEKLLTEMKEQSGDFVPPEMGIK